MYIILVPNRLWYTADTWQEVIDFLKIVFTSDSNTFYKTKVLKCNAPYVWEEVFIPEENNKKVITSSL